MYKNAALISGLLKWMGASRWTDSFWKDKSPVGNDDSGGDSI